MNQPLHIRHTVHKLGRQLESMVGKHISPGAAFDILAKKSSSIEDMVVVEVMREVYLEMQTLGIGAGPHAAHADSSTRSARTSAMALSR